MSRIRRLLIVLGLNLALVAVLVAVGLGAHSLAVLAEGGDYLLDAAGVGVALLAIRLSARPASGARRRETPRAPNVGGAGGEPPPPRRWIGFSRAPTGWTACRCSS